MFSRTTIIKLVDALIFQKHAEVEKFALEFALEDVIDGLLYIDAKKVAIMRYLITNPQATAPTGTTLIHAIIEHLISKVPEPKEQFPELINSLDRDGYILDRNGLRRKLPSQLPTIEKEDELIESLDRFGYTVAKGHYEQAVSAHTRGDWAAANAQLRSFVEEFLNRVTDTLAHRSYTHSHQMFGALANLGFFRSDLNEWSNDGKGFVQGFWRRLHPQGSHPGLSEKEDSTFRLHIVIIVMHYFAKRIETFLQK